MIREKRKNFTLEDGSWLSNFSVLIKYLHQSLTKVKDHNFNTHKFGNKVQAYVGSSLLRKGNILQLI